MTLTVETECDLAYFAAPAVFEKKKISKTEVKATYKGSSKECNCRALNFYYATADLQAPELVVAQSDKYPDQTAVLFSFAPSFAKKEKTKPKEFVFGTSAREAKLQEDLDQEGGSYIFLVDRSGSMSGESIRLTREAMVLFMRSLPVGSKFQIISYGTNFHYFSGKKELLDYNKKNMDKAIKYIEKMEADMRQNNEMQPLQNSIDILKKDEFGKSRNVFLLTDGGVGVGGTCTEEELLKFGEKNKDFATIHTIGLGDGVEKNFCL